MKTRIHPKAGNTGSVLLVTLGISLVIGVTLASYLLLVQSENKSMARSQTWNTAIVVAEAGVEDALAFLNKFVGTRNLTNWPSSSAADNWSASGNVYSATRYLDALHTTYYTVYITNNASNTPQILSTGYAPGSANTTVSRTILVQTSTGSLFNYCMAALGGIDLKGNGIATDSFDSTDPRYSVNGYYSPLLHKAGGDVVTDDTITNSALSVGNANIAGHVSTGPNGSISIGPNGTVGDLAWVASSMGIEPGWSANDLNVLFKDAVEPAVSWLSPSSVTGIGGPSTNQIISPTSGNPGNLQSYDHVFTIPGNYVVADSGTIYVGTNVTVTIRATASTFNPNRVYVAGTGSSAGSLTIYMEGSSATLGTDDMTQSGLAKNIAFFGMPSCTSVSYKGNGDFTGLIYAPEADFQLAGGGSGIIDFIGSSVSKTVQMNGHYHFHYDESLKNFILSNGYIASQWNEM
ncbi:MAG: hypothetical protein JWR26_3497 [Pedosphaera sp.]|nr:hypothetical protein [Pedosphaera sp.]